MINRKFIKVRQVSGVWMVTVAMTALCYILMTIPVLAAGGAASHVGRDKVSFNPGWKFIKADPAGAARSDFDDAA